MTEPDVTGVVIIIVILIILFVIGRLLFPHQFVSEEKQRQYEFRSRRNFLFAIFAAIVIYFVIHSLKH